MYLFDTPPSRSKIAHLFAVTYKAQRFTSSSKYLSAGFGEKVCSICLLCASGNLEKVLWGFVFVFWFVFFNESEKGRKEGVKEDKLGVEESCKK